jgi:hypothetical protein
MTKAEPANIEPDGSETPWIPSRIIFLYVSKVIKAARKQGKLEVPDMPQHVRMLTAELAAHFNAALKRRQARPKKEPKLRKDGKKARVPTGAMDVFRALISGRLLVVVLTAVGYAITTGLGLAGPLLLNRIVKGLSCRAIPAAARVQAHIVCDSDKTLYLCVASSPRLCSS